MSCFYFLFNQFFHGLKLNHDLFQTFGEMFSNFSFARPASVCLMRAKAFKISVIILHTHTHTHTHAHSTLIGFILLDFWPRFQGAVREDFFGFLNILYAPNWPFSSTYWVGKLKKKKWDLKKKFLFDSVVSYFFS